MEDDEVEWLWAKPLPEYRAELRNYPFFAYGLNWGDVVRCELDDDGLPWVAEVLTRSGNRTIRLFFETDTSEAERTAVLGELQRRDVWYESTDADSTALYAFNVLPHVDFGELLDFLAVQEEQGVLSYEDAS